MKGKIKRAAVLACILLLCALAALCLAACAPDDEFAGEALAAGEVRGNGRDGQAIVRQKVQVELSLERTLSETYRPPRCTSPGTLPRPITLV